MTDLLQRFVFDDLDARGAIVRLSETCESIQTTHHYPPALASLLNQFAATACLLRDSIKVEASVTIQLRSSGAIELIMADCQADNRVRAICEYDNEGLPSVDRIELDSLATDAVMAITITPNEGERYQGVVPIEKPSLEECLEDYFVRSEQLPTWFKLLADSDQVVGIAIHALPQEKVTDIDQSAEHFSRLNILLKSLQANEALTLDNAQILTRLFHEEQCRLFDGESVRFGCDCSEQRSMNAILSLGHQEAMQLIEEQQADGESSFTVDCHFCFQRYVIEHSRVIDLLSESATVN